MIRTNIEKLRDPFLLKHDGVYHLYGGVWECYQNTSGNLDGNWVRVEDPVEIPKDAVDNYWAPEVHKYGDKFYMFTTYYSAKTKHRGCTILEADSPKGPFREITGGHITPKDWDAIDGTLYIENGEPWMIFVHEWTSTDDGIGRMAAAKLSDDLTHFVSEPIELFRADDPLWAKRQITDGCFLYKTKDGQLLMVWSNFDADGYAIGVARSDNGRLDGNWSQDEELLVSRKRLGKYDGGHGMIFTDTDGKMYLSFHSPNTACEETKEAPVFLAIKEENGTLVWNET